MLQLSTNRYGNASRNSIYILCGRLYVRMFVMRCSYCRVDCIRTNCGDLNAVGPTNSSAILEHPSDIIVAIAANKSPRRSSFRSSRDATPDAIVPTNTDVCLCFYLPDLFGKRKTDWPIRWSEVQYIFAQGAYTSIRCIDGKLTETMAVFCIESRQNCKLHSVQRDWFISGKLIDIVYADGMLDRWPVRGTRETDGQRGGFVLRTVVCNFKIIS